MAITNGYATRDELKKRISIESADTLDDTVIDAVIEGVSRWIDLKCERHFYQVTETRYFTPEWSDLLVIDDLTAVTTLKTDEDGDRVYETTWAATDYDLWPYEGKLSGTTWAYKEIRITPRGLRSFPVGLSRSVEIAANWGWPAVPKGVKEACLLQSARMFKRKEAAFGITGAADFGQAIAITRVDPDVWTNLHPFLPVDAV